MGRIHATSQSLDKHNYAYRLTFSYTLCYNVTSYFLLEDIVTNMENRFPTVLVLWLGREFYRGKYGMTGSSEAWTPDLGDRFGDLGDNSKIPENASLFSISLLGEEIFLNVRDDSM
ncbi:hypothetical protein AVEN_201618-1 [Araneus ventricosus]|uniref:Uncharacterized protein n=1 Tax=Araneus ventricosus TaxID=182803 RepID=A0A4Y2V117_ARAVE|nr:hypothetical protein AVEN_188187-1 [Araneus ventricosus]GBO18895.1 hypothetical protein AVEN_201618-1 [Araneus ventricosus]